MSLHPRVRQTLGLILKLGIGAGLIVWLIRSGKLQPGEIWDAIRSNPFWLALVFVIYNGCILLTGSRWHMLLVSQGLHPTWRECIGMTYTGCFFSCFLPGGTGGDLVKAYYVARDSHKKAEAVTTVFLDRVLGLYCMIGFAAVAMLFRLPTLWHYGETPGAAGLTQMQGLVVSVLGAFAVATVGLIVFLSSHCRRLVHYLLDKLPERVGPVLKRVYEAVYHYRGQKLLLLKFVLYSASAHGLCSVAMWVVGLSLHDPIAEGGTRALNYFFIIPLGLVLNGLPIAPAGVGVFEWALKLLFGTVLVSGEANVGANVAALGHIIIILTNQVGLFFYLAGKRRVAEAMQEARAAGSAPHTDA
jgi:uncharacterized protein (TIRG00374 family)